MLPLAATHAPRIRAPSRWGWPALPCSPLKLAFKQHFVDERAPKPYQEGDRPLIGRASRGHVPPPQEVIEQSVRLYDANILWADHNLGLVLDELRRRGLFDDALIIATSDHGEAFWQHGILGHGYGLYEEECRVPLIFKLPAGQGPRGDQVPVIASLMDVVPTLGEYLNLRRPEAPLDGRSLLPFLREPDTPDDGHRVLLRTHNEVGKFALRSSGQKVIVRTERDEHGELQVSRVELYDLERDPLELDDLASERADEAARWAAEIVALVGRLATESGTTAAELSNFELELLEQLGYVGGQDTGER